MTKRNFKLLTLSMIAMALGKNCLFQIAGKVNRIIRELGLRELGQLEQDLVFGDAGMKDVIKFLNTKDVRNYRSIYMDAPDSLSSYFVKNIYHFYAGYDW